MLPSRQDIAEHLTLLETDPDALTRWCAEIPLIDGERAATNLRLLHEQLNDRDLLADIFTAAIEVADPDAALNNLERLFDVVDQSHLITTLSSKTGRAQLLTILGGSAFLAGILCRNRDYFSQLLVAGDLQQPRDEARMLADLRMLISDDADFAALKAGLRRYKAQQILRIGARDLCGLADLEEVMLELSGLAAASLQRAYELCSWQLQVDYGEPLHETTETTAQTPQPAAMTIIAMGKFGGRELNFSSDIDLIYCYSSTRGETTGGRRNEQISLHRYFVKLAEMVTRALHQITEDGFVFRVDTRLRPDGNSGDLAISLDGAEIYYESWGQSWERAAMLKARPVAGSIPLGEELLKRLKPFVFRRYLDFGMIEDMKVMKQKINASLDRRQEHERNLKLGVGGIREIEFFIQAQQLVNAGTRPRLQQRNSLQMLLTLREEEMLSATDQQTLTAAYRFLRSVEHRIQVVQEQQTHSLPNDDRSFTVLARRCGFADAVSFEAQLQTHRQAVNAIFNDLFHSADEEIEQVSPEVRLLLSREADSDLAKDILEAKGFANPDSAYRLLAFLRGEVTGRRMTRRGRRCLDRLAPLLLGELFDSPNPGQALNNLDEFLNSIRARSPFFSLLMENPAIAKLLVTLFGSSQMLSRIFIQRPELLDTMVAQSSAVALKTREQMHEELAEQLALGEDFEHQLDLLRRYRNEELLRIALNDLHGGIRQRDTTRQLSLLAEVCLEAACRMARQELIPRFGAPFADGKDEETAFTVVGMGKLGGHELNYHSDLDIIFIYEEDGETRPLVATDSERFRRLSSHEYFAKLAQRIITILTLGTREGFVYKIDTRLRPSGNQGPLVTSLAAFKRYHCESAQPWERQAMTRARAVTGNRVFRDAVQSTITELTFDRPLPDNLQAEIYRLRQRMEQEIARESGDLLNIKTGRGGMVDVEFVTQYLQLQHAAEVPQLKKQNTIELLEIMAQQQLLLPTEAETLIDGYKFLRRLENKLRLLYDQSISELSVRGTSFRQVARSLGYRQADIPPEQAFMEEYRTITEKIRELMEFYLAPQAGDK